jgi:hypothetical protein
LQFASKRRTPGSGSLLRRRPDGRQEMMVSGLNYPTGLELGPDGNFDVSENGRKSENASGHVLRVHPATP